MIKFFRRIRQNLMMENKTGRYFKYAIGEIILVVIGILIALQINNWNEYRKERHEEQMILLQLKEDFKSNLTQLEQRIKIRDNIISNATELLTYFGRPEAISEDSIYSKFARTANPTSFDPVENNLIATGNIRLIQSQKLRQLLTNWSTDVLQLKEIEQVFFRFYENDFTVFMREKGIGRDASFVYWEDKKHIISLLNSDNVYNPIPGKSIISANVKDQLNNPQFESLLTQAINLNVVNNLESATLKEQILKILETIENEIKQESR